jgi:hypothetical protein
MNFLQPLFLLSLLAVLALIAIYLWHPRRLRQTVSQVFLFLRARRELLTRFTRWRFLRSLILLLQVLTLVFLGLAAALPQSDLYPLSGNRCAIVVDVSLSMMAQDVSPDRFHVALEKTRQLARELLQGNNLVSVWTLGKNPTLVIDYSNKLGALDRAIQSIKPEFSAPTNIDDLLALLSDKAGKMPLVTYVISDLSLEVLPRQCPFLELHSVAIGEAIPNYAIVGCAQEGPALWVRLANFSPVAKTLHLVVDDGLAPQVQSIDLPAMQTGELSILLARTPTLLRLHLQEKDLQSWDNALLIPQTAPPRVVLVGSSPFLESALKAAGLHVVKVGAEDWRPEIPADVLVFEGFLPNDPPRHPFLSVNPPAGNALFPWTGTVTRPILWTNPSLLFSYLDFSRAAFLETPILQLPTTMEPLLETSGGALMLSGQVKGMRAVVLGPSLALSNLPLLPAFPLFLAQAIHWLASDPKPFQAFEGEALLLGPLVADYLGSGHPPGLYGRQAVDGLRLFGVASLDPHEANLMRHTELEGLGGSAQVRTVPRDLITVFLIPALVALLLEEVLRRRYD